MVVLENALELGSSGTFKDFLGASPQIHKLFSLSQELVANRRIVATTPRGLLS
jgi:hypothetical protein